MDVFLLLPQLGGESNGIKFDLPKSARHFSKRVVRASLENEFSESAFTTLL